MMAMDQAKDLDNDTAFAVFTHDLGKGITPKEILPSHRGHERAGVPLVETVCNRLKVPKNHKRLALNVCRWHLHSHMAYDLRAGTIHKLFEKTGAYQQCKNFDKFLQACQADATGRLGMLDSDYPQATYLKACLKEALAVDVQQLIQKGFSGEKLGDEIAQQKIKRIKRYKRHYFNQN